MNKITFILTIITTLCSVAYGQKKKNDWKESNLRGKIKQVEQANFIIQRDDNGVVIDSMAHENENNLIYAELFDKKGRTIEKGFRNVNGDIKRYHFYHYNKKVKTEEKIYFPLDSFLIKKTFSYDKKNRLVKVTSEIENDFNKKSKTNYLTLIYKEYLYNEQIHYLEDKNNYIKKHYNHRNELFQTTKASYDKKSKETTYIYYNSDDKIVKKVKNYDNKKGKILLSVLYDGEDKLIEEKKYIYDAKNRLKKVETHNLILETHYHSVYNDNEDEIEYTVFKDSFNKITFFYKHTYDSNGNWTRSEQYTQDNQLIYVSHRLFIYY